MNGNSLRLHQELLLLALHDQKGTLAFGQMIDIGLGGALLTELLLAGNVGLVDSTGWRSRQFVEVTQHPPTGDVAMDAALQDIASERRATPAATVPRIGRIPGLRNLIAADLAGKGILQESEERVLLLFRRRVYPTVNPEPERAVIARVRAALEGTGSVELRTAALIGIANATGSLTAIYRRAELRQMRKRIKAIRDADVGSKAARQAIEAAQAAILAAAAVAAVAAGGS